MTYVPERGDIVWMTFDPQVGHEQAGRRPALILSPLAYNGRTRLALLCPMTRQSKGIKFEVAIPSGLPVSGVILSDHLKSLDWHEREAQFICRVPDTVILDVLQRLEALIF
jgi:mRNA interferase MazF